MNQACHIGGSEYFLLFKYHLIEEGGDGVHQKHNFAHRAVGETGEDLNLLM